MHSNAERKHASSRFFFEVYGIFRQLKTIKNSISAGSLERAGEPGDQALHVHEDVNVQVLF